ncbi:hypothetical protein PMIN03_001904 [Paraphaeosphaeria minitans]
MRLSVSQICSITTLLCAGSYALVPPRASATSRTGRILTGGTLPPDALDYAAHCVTHDLNSVISDRGHQPEVVHELLIADSIRTFQSVMDGTVWNTSRLSPYSAGH